MLSQYVRKSDTRLYKPKISLELLAEHFFLKLPFNLFRNKDLKNGLNFDGSLILIVVSINVFFMFDVDLGSNYF